MGWPHPCSFESFHRTQSIFDKTGWLLTRRLNTFGALQLSVAHKVFFFRLLKCRIYFTSSFPKKSKGRRVQQSETKDQKVANRFFVVSQRARSNVRLALMYHIVFRASQSLNPRLESWECEVAVTMDDGTTAGGSSFLTSSAEHQFSGDSHPIPPEVLELFDDPVEGEEVDDIITKGKVPFFAGNPTVGLVKGEIHIFKDTNIREIATNKTLPSARTRIVCVLAVPAWMSLADFYTFCGPHTAYLEQLRVLSDASPNRYMAVMKFKKQKQADDFYLQFNGKPFSSLAPEACYVGFVKKVEFLQPEDAQIFPLQVRLFLVHSCVPRCT
jgi:hypothetical protein